MRKIKAVNVTYVGDEVWVELRPALLAGTSTLTIERKDQKSKRVEKGSGRDHKRRM